MSALDSDLRGVQYVVARTGLTYRQIDHWIRFGAITIEDGTDHGSGNSRVFRLQEVNDLEAIAKIVRIARAAGFSPDRRAISSMWTALQRGESWRLVLDVDEVMS